jgi:hypothetical protein
VHLQLPRFALLHRVSVLVDNSYVNVSGIVGDEDVQHLGRADAIKDGDPEPGLPAFASTSTGFM